jgi:hypothetical protein
MALSRFVVTARVVLTPDAIAAVVAGEPGTGGPAGFGNTATITPAAGSEGKYGYLAQTVIPGQVIYADSTAGFATGAQLLYQAIGASNLRPYADTDAAGHAALAN